MIEQPVTVRITSSAKSVGAARLAIAKMGIESFEMSDAQFIATHCSPQSRRQQSIGAMVSGARAVFELIGFAAVVYFIAGWFGLV